ncbi:MAG: MYXO-CTERM domain-containing protein [Myxococcota bacterium]
MTTALGAGCRCDAGQVARTFRDLDGLPSVTCQPRQALVDLGADIELPDSCKGVTVADGTCVDVGGFPSSECAGTAAGVLRDGLAPPTCVEIQQQTGSPGAENFSQKLNGLDVCSPRPRACGNLGWLVANPNPNIVGISCPKNQPSQDAFLEPTAPQCPGTGEDVSVTDSGSDTGADSNRADADDGAADGRGTVRVGGGCQGADLDASWLLALSLLGLAVLRQRRRGDLL